MSKEIIFPCPTCVVLASCKARCKQYADEKQYDYLKGANVFLVIALNACPLMKEYIYDGKSKDAGFISSRLETAREFYKDPYE